MSTTKIEKIRGEIAAKQLELTDAENAGAPYDEVVSELLAQHAAGLLEPYFRATNGVARAAVGARDAGDLSLARAFGLTFGNADGFLAGAIVRHLGSEIIADIRDEMARIADCFPPPLADGERQARLAKLKAEIRALGRREEAEIEAEEMAGNHIDRRPDADPVCVLGIPDAVALEFGL